MVKLTVNGTVLSVDLNPTTPLLWVIRDQLRLTGTKYGCGIAQCGSCTVLFDGEAVRSCVIPLAAAQGRDIETIENLAKGGKLSKVQQAWVEHQVPQCGYCQSGMVMAATALLKKTPNPSDAEIDAAMTNICRCGTFQEVRAAIHSAAKAKDSP
jgi:isoquinoline 1-oxidoreductase alpha subunit